MRSLPILFVIAGCCFTKLNLIAHEHENIATSGTIPAHKATNKVEGDYRVIHVNGIPDHPTGEFPNRFNPNRIQPQDKTYRVPVRPVSNKVPTPLGMHPFGVALNGIVFDPSAAEWWNRDRQSGWQYEPLHMHGKLGADQHNGHVQPTGAYHYHGIPTGLLESLSAGKKGMVLVGWAADGFPIYGPWGPADRNNLGSLHKKLTSSYQLKKGTRSNGPDGSYDGTFVADYEFVRGTGDLDECNGRFGATPEFPGGVYYYVLTEQFPYIPRAFMGTPDPSFLRKGPPGAPGSMRPRPPHEQQRASLPPEPQGKNPKQRASGKRITEN